MSARWIVPVVLILATVSPMANQVSAQRGSPARDPRRVEAQARLQLDSGRDQQSGATFDTMLAVSRTRRDSAASIFGKAFAEQQMIDADSIPVALADGLIAHYLNAVRLDQSRYRTAARMNVALP